jgi:hypothetical protein
VLPVLRRLHHDPKLNGKRKKRNDKKSGRFVEPYAERFVGSYAGAGLGAEGIAVEDRSFRQDHRRHCHQGAMRRYSSHC